MADMEVADYLAHVDERLAQEEQRVTHYLETSTRRHLLNAAENALIAAHAENIVQKGFDKLVEQGRVSVRYLSGLSAKPLYSHHFPPQ